MHHARDNDLSFWQRATWIVGAGLAAWALLLTLGYVSVKLI